MVLDRLNLLQPGKRFLNFAPEPFMLTIGRKIIGDSYVGADFEPELFAKYRANLQKIDMCNDLSQLEPESFDVVMHNHVLEHVPCEIAPVLRNINRLVAPGGVHLFSTPIMPNRKTTADLNPALSGEERRRRFGQDDHMRMFGADDFGEILADAGMDEGLMDLSNLLSRDQLETAAVPVDVFQNFNGSRIFAWRRLCSDQSIGSAQTNQLRKRNMIDEETATLDIGSSQDSNSGVPPEFAQVPTHGGGWYSALLTQAHKDLAPRNYLEIGTLTGATLALASCPSIAIDPKFKISSDVIRNKEICHFFQMTSDKFFESVDPRGLLGESLDFAFLDGLHLYEYLLRDFMNTERFSKRDTVIAIHDCLPTDSHAARRDMGEMTLSKYSPRADWWAGDIWKTIVILKQYRPDLQIHAFNAPPTGLVLVTNLSPESEVLRHNYEKAVRDIADLSYAEYGIDRYFSELNVQSTDTVKGAGDLLHLLRPHLHLEPAI